MKRNSQRKDAHRNMLLLTKILQQLANRTTVKGVKEEFMSIIQPFIDEQEMRFELFCEDFGGGLTRKDWRCCVKDSPGKPFLFGFGRHVCVFVCFVCSRRRTHCTLDTPISQPRQI